MDFDKKKKNLMKCSACGKTLIERKSNGLWYFVFGKGFSGDGTEIFIPVELFIHGNIKMRCLRRSCRKQHPAHWNVFNFWPGPGQDELSIGPAPNSETADINKQKGGK